MATLGVQTQSTFKTCFVSIVMIITFTLTQGTISTLAPNRQPLTRLWGSLFFWDAWACPWLSPTSSPCDWRTPAERTLAAIRHIFWCQISSTHSCRRGGGRSGGGGGGWGGGGRRQRGGGGVRVDESKQGRAWSWHVASLKVLFSGRVSWCCQQGSSSSSSAYYHHHYYSTPSSSPLLTVVDYPNIFAWPCDVGGLQWLAVLSRFLGDGTKETEPRHADAVWDI